MKTEAGTKWRGGTSSFLPFAGLRKLKSRQQVLILAALCLSLLWGLVRWLPAAPGSMLVIRTANDMEVQWHTAVETGDVLVFHWIHSVEHIPWQETFEVTAENTLMLTESRFAGFGAGIPHENQGGVRVEDGWVILDNIQREIKQYDWIHSHTALPEIWLNGKVMLQGADLPHHQPLTLTIEER
ncbi:DUF1850 domain-containing protein [Anoxynatronum buryatiense]|uniref:DUF1850 domain-containing protein n=1 Tax=Anoxynatronum buryatiense TaxID=489973 RepID=A0AA45WWI4_9CLOT|nr:DUF1850 domain-containing protein [Anoxynatronum buryatiense]SMP60019.1 protein of unknown function [Anoxynatronum buryatiense]